MEYKHQFSIFTDKETWKNGKEVFSLLFVFHLQYKMQLTVLLLAQ